MSPAIEVRRRRKPPLSPFIRRLECPPAQVAIPCPVVIPKALLKQLQEKKGLTMNADKLLAKDTLIVVVIDKSGSMKGRAAEVISGFNQFVATQKSLPGKAAMSIVFFDTTYYTPVVNMPLERIHVLDDTNYVPMGFTALLDAVGRAITDTDVVLGDRQAIICIVTDGAENSSHEYSRTAIKQMIEARQEKGWDFIYLGANQNAFAEAGAIGIRTLNTSGYSADINGQTMASYAAVSNATSSKRMTGKVDPNWKAGSGLNPDPQDPQTTTTATPLVQ